MNYGIRYCRYLPGQRVVVWDDYVARWREATVLIASLTLVTAVSMGGHRYDDLPATSKWVRPVRIVRKGGLSVRRAA